MPENKLYEDIGAIKALLQIQGNQINKLEVGLTEVRTLVTNWKVGFGMLLTLGSIGMAVILAWGNILSFFAWLSSHFVFVPK